MSMTIRRSGLFALVGTFLLVNCGGGGGGGGSTQDTAPTVTITQSNGDQVAAQAVDSDDVASESSSLLFGGLSVEADSSSIDLSDIGRFLVSGIRPSSGEITIQDHYFICDSGGVTEDLGESSGSITFNDCVIAGITINGSVSYSGGSSANTIDFTLNDFSISDGSGLNAGLDGDMTVKVVTIDSVDVTTISGRRLTITANAEFVRFMDYHLSTEYDGLTGTYTSDLEYTLESSLIGGRVRVTTDPAEGGAPLVTLVGDLYPSSGSVVAIGAGGTRVRATALDNVNVMIEYDENGDGAYESSTTMTWAELDLLDEV